MQTCYLVGAAPDAVRIEVQPDDFVIAVDEGVNYLREWGIVPNMIVGDLQEVDYELHENVRIIKTSPEKRSTDMVFAFSEGYRMGMRHFVITGASGGRRVDHSMATLQLLTRAAALGAFAMVMGNEQCVTAITDKGELRLSGKGIVSILAYSKEATGVTVRGMRDNKENVTLRSDTPRGVNNYLDGEGFITMESGVLAIFWETNKVNLIEYFVNI